jgi:hypothetical protein
VSRQLVAPSCRAVAATAKAEAPLDRAKKEAVFCSLSRRRERAGVRESKCGQFIFVCRVHPVPIAPRNKRKCRLEFCSRGSRRSRFNEFPSSTRPLAIKHKDQTFQPRTRRKTRKGFFHSGPLEFSAFLRGNLKRAAGESLRITIRARLRSYQRSDSPAARLGLPPVQGMIKCHCVG